MQSSLLHYPGGAHHKPAMTRGGGGACEMRSAAVRGPRSLPALEDVGTDAPVLPLLGLPVAALVDEAGLSGQRVPALVEPQRLVAFVLPACRGRQRPLTAAVFGLEPGGGASLGRQAIEALLKMTWVFSLVTF